MATGENSGTWGQKSNTNLQILEDAIAGTEAITLSSSDVTLTDTQFTFGQQSHAAILSLTGTLKNLFGQKRDHRRFHRHGQDRLRHWRRGGPRADDLGAMRFHQRSANR